MSVMPFAIEIFHNLRRADNSTPGYHERRVWIYRYKSFKLFYLSSSLFCLFMDASWSTYKKPCSKMCINPSQCIIDQF